MNREKGLELFGKFIRTKNVDSLQGDQRKTGPEPLHPTDSKQKLQASIFSYWVFVLFWTFSNITSNNPTENGLNSWTFDIVNNDPNFSVISIILALRNIRKI